MLPGILLALASALVFAAAATAQATATRAIALAAPPPRGRIATLVPVLSLLPRMLASRLWWLGLGGNFLGFLFHASALHAGAIGIVQALLCVQLMFALPFATARLRRPPLIRDWFGTITTCGGIAMLVTARGGVPQTFDRVGHLPYVLVTAFAVMAALVVVAHLARRTLRASLVGTAAGIGFSVSATLIVTATHHLSLTNWAIYVLPVSGLIAAILAQDAYASGSFPAALTAMTVADPVAAWLWGAILFDAVPPTTPAAVAGLTASGLLICIGVAVLANSPTLSPAPRETALSTVGKRKVTAR